MLASRRIAAVLAVLCAVSLAGCGKNPGPRPLPEQGNTYVALGDSFTAVAGTGPFTDPKFCLRSTDNYPHLVAEKLHLKPFADDSCGGAAPHDLTQAQLVTGEGGRGTNQPQLNAVSEDTTLVTVGIGLNESVGNRTTIAFLLTDICRPKHVDEKCQAYQRLGAKVWTDAIDQLGDDIATSLGQIHERAPKARIVLVGYPRVVPDTGSCAAVPLPGLALNRLRTTMMQVNVKFKAVAAAAGADYVDMYAASKGHDACSAQPWVNGEKANSKAFRYHPYKSYHRAVAAQIVALLKTKKPQA